MSKVRNDVAKVDRKSVISTQNFFIEELRSMFALGGNNQELTQEQIALGQNALEVMIELAMNEGKDVLSYSRSKTLFALRRVMSLNWNIQNGEGAIILQRRKKSDNTWETYFDLRPTAKGYIKSVRTMGAGLRRDIDPIVADWLVCEGDEFTDIEYVGLEVKPPTFKPKRLSNKVMYIVYGLARTDNTIQWVIAHREQVKPALIAQAKSNGSPQEDLDKMAKMTVDEIIEEYSNKKFKKGNYMASYLNATWTEEQNRESMVETKLRGVMANRMIDKHIENAYQAEAFKHTIIEHPNIVEYKDDEVIEIAGMEIEEKSGSEEIFEVDDRMVEEIEIIEEDVETDDEVEETEEVDYNDLPFEVSKEEVKKDIKEVKDDVYDEFIEEPKNKVEETKEEPKDSLFEFDY